MSVDALPRGRPFYGDIQSSRNFLACPASDIWSSRLRDQAHFERADPIDGMQTSACATWSAGRTFHGDVRDMQHFLVSRHTWTRAMPCHCSGATERPSSMQTSRWVHRRTFRPDEELFQLIESGRECGALNRVCSVAAFSVGKKSRFIRMGI